VPGCDGRTDVSMMAKTSEALHAVARNFFSNNINDLGLGVYMAEVQKCHFLWLT